MAFISGRLAEGQLPNAKGTLYTVPANTRAHIKFMSLYNSNVGAEAVTIYVKAGTSRVVYTNPTLATLTTARPLANANEVLILSAGDLIEGVTTTASKVDYWISGILET